MEDKIVKILLDKLDKRQNDKALLSQQSDLDMRVRALVESARDIREAMASSQTGSFPRPAPPQGNKNGSRPFQGRPMLCYHCGKPRYMRRNCPYCTEDKK